MKFKVTTVSNGKTFSVETDSTVALSDVYREVSRTGFFALRGQVSATKQKKQEGVLVVGPGCLVTVDED